MTEVPFPRNDNLCTRFATEIILRRAPNNSLTIKIIPDEQRPALEQKTIKGFEESITNFDELPKVMKMAMEIMDKYFPRVTSFLNWQEIVTNLHFVIGLGVFKADYTQA